MNDDIPYTAIGDEAVEARIIAWVAGESSAFEAEELARLCAEKPELEIFRRRMAALDVLLKLEQRNSKPDAEWQLAPARRRKIEELAGVPDAAMPKRIRVFRPALRVLAMAAAVVFLTGGLFIAVFYRTRVIAPPVAKKVDFMPTGNGGGYGGGVAAESSSSKVDLAELNKAIREQEDKVEEKRKNLAIIARTKRITYTGNESQIARNSRDSDVEDAVKQSIDGRDYAAAKNEFESDQQRLSALREKKAEAEIASSLPSLGSLFEGSAGGGGVGFGRGDAAAPAGGIRAEMGESGAAGLLAESDDVYTGKDRGVAPFAGQQGIASARGRLEEPADLASTPATPQPAQEKAANQSFGQSVDQLGPGTANPFGVTASAARRKQEASDEIAQEKFKYGGETTPADAPAESRLNLATGDEKGKFVDPFANSASPSGERLEARKPINELSLAESGKLAEETVAEELSLVEKLRSADAGGKNSDEAAGWGLSAGVWSTRFSEGDEDVSGITKGGRFGDFTIERHSIDGVLNHSAPADGKQEPAKKKNAMPTLRKAVSSPVPTDEISAKEEPFSTFSLNVSDASFQIARAALLKGGQPDPAAIKVEQFYNAMEYGDPAPRAGEAVAVKVEQAAHPIVPGRTLVRIAAKVGAEGRTEKPLRLTLLVDQSGSMVREDRKAAMTRALSELQGLLKKADRVTVIGFSRTPRLIAEELPGDQAGKLAGLIKLEAAEGGTNLEEALKLAWSQSLKGMNPSSVSRVVLFTDGAANLGDADPDRLAAVVKGMAQSGLGFDIAGMGADELNDRLLGELARHGNGRYHVVNADGGDDLARKLAGAFRPAAENVKVQVRFNPERVSRYKLIGFEKDRLKKEDFRNDAVDAAELAAEEAGVAIYQVETLPDGRGEIGEVAVRFRDTASNEMVERSWSVPYEAKTPALDQAAPSMQLAVLAMLAGEEIKGGPLAEAIDFKEMSKMTAEVKRYYRNSRKVAELLDVVDRLVRRF
ncbi:MAG: von Willebrand factor type A domain-containing protein [Verrucomicrobiota bacterium]